VEQKDQLQLPLELLDEVGDELTYRGNMLDWRHFPFSMFDITTLIVSAIFGQTLVSQGHETIGWWVLGGSFVICIFLSVASNLFNNN